MTSNKHHHVIRIERDNSDYILPKNFFEILVQRFCPVISLIYIISIIGIALNMDKPFHHVFFDNTAYVRGIVLVLSCSGPAIIWILLNAHPMASHYANLWYKIISGLLVLTIALSYFLFPETQMYSMRAYLILSIPAFLLMYYLLVIDPIPLGFVYPVNALGVCAIIWAVSAGSVLT